MKVNPEFVVCPFTDRNCVITCADIEMSVNMREERFYKCLRIRAEGGDTKQSFLAMTSNQRSGEFLIYGKP